MPRRISLSQFRSQQRQAVNKYNQAVNRHNQEVRRQEQARKQAVNKANQEIAKYNQEGRRQEQARKQAVTETKHKINKYNQAVRAYNAKVRADRQRILGALTRLESRPVVEQYTTLRTSVETVNKAFVRLDRETTEEEAEAYGHFLVDLPHRENANNLEMMDALLSEEADAEGVNAEALQGTKITTHLEEISPELSKRWFGAVHALTQHDQNPDATRHFCASAREIFTTIFSLRAPDEAVFEAMPDCRTTLQGKPTRRAKIQYLLRHKGIYTDNMEDFVEEDVASILKLFDVLSGGTHGPAGVFGLRQLLAIKKRVEDGILCLTDVVR